MLKKNSTIKFSLLKFLFVITTSIIGTGNARSDFGISEKDTSELAKHTGCPNILAMHLSLHYLIDDQKKIPDIVDHDYSITKDLILDLKHEDAKKIKETLSGIDTLHIAARLNTMYCDEATDKNMWDEIRPAQEPCSYFISTDKGLERMLCKIDKKYSAKPVCAFYTPFKREATSIVTCGNQHVDIQLDPQANVLQM
ncbi:MAG: hypothetical protein GY782_06450 [Gammaproteobacteria bacterium]|nr:hypothetical protein [Gammaproteobacteria bacterium]